MKKKNFFPIVEQSPLQISINNIDKKTNYSTPNIILRKQLFFNEKFHSLYYIISLSVLRLHKAFLLHNY